MFQPANAAITEAARRMNSAMMLIEAELESSPGASADTLRRLRLALGRIDDACFVMTGKRFDSCFLPTMEMRE